MSNSAGQVIEWILTDENNFISLKLNNEKNKVNLEINDGRTYEFIVKIENDKLNIYGKENNCNSNDPITLEDWVDARMQGHTFLPIMNRVFGIEIIIAAVLLILIWLYRWLI